MNKILLIGNLTRDPELTTTSNGISVTKFSIAVNRNYTNANGEREADFLNIICWKQLAESCAKYLKKGKKVGISGSLQIRNYEDKDSIKRTVAEIVAEDVEFLTPNDNSNASSNYDSNNNSKKTENKIVEYEGDLPF